MWVRRFACLCLAIVPRIGWASERLPYEPWHDSDPLSTPTPIPAPGPAPEKVSEEYARRLIEIGASTAMRPLSCLSGSRDCAAQSFGLAARHRPSPHVAWSLNAETARFRGQNETYVGVGARVYPSRSGVLDPFVELGLGGDFTGGPDEPSLASELGFGLSVALSERVKLVSELTAHQRGTSCEVCRSVAPWAKRWITLGLGVELWLGEKH